MDVTRYLTAVDDEWDAFVGAAVNGTFLHTRRYLSYHRDRFQDESRLIRGSDGQLLAVFPAARDPQEPQTVISHPGITYGGLVHDHRLYGHRLVEAFESLVADFARDGYRKLVYKAIPNIYHTQPADDDLYALARMGAKWVRCDLSCAIEVNNRGPVSSRRKRALRAATKAGIAIRTHGASLADFWGIVEDTLLSRHGVRPVHTLGEMQGLMERFPQEISLSVALRCERLVGGVVVYSTGRVRHIQYSIAGDEGREVGALDALIEHTIEAARRAGATFVSMGISTEDGGQTLNSGLYEYKHSFGSGGVVHNFFEVQCHQT